jgi:hypothetical protein
MRISFRSLLALLNQPHAQGGHLSAQGCPDGKRLIELSPGRLITDPDEAEALGLTADARRMRG